MGLALAVVGWPLLAVVMLIVGLSAFPLAPIAVLFARVAVDAQPLGVSLYRLPTWARYLETPDDNNGLLPGGLYEPVVRWVYERLGWQAASIYWLWRNRAGRFDGLFRVTPHPNDPIWHAGNQWIGDDLGHSGGWVVFRLSWAWEVYVVKPLIGQFGIRLRLGWRIQPYFNGPWPTDPNTASGTPIAHVSFRRLKWA